MAGEEPAIEKVLHILLLVGFAWVWVRVLKSWIGFGLGLVNL